LFLTLYHIFLFAQFFAFTFSRAQRFIDLSEIISPFAFLFLPWISLLFFPGSGNSAANLPIKKIKGGNFMAGCGGVGGSGNSGGSNSVGGANAAGSAGKSSADSSKGTAVGANNTANDTAKTNNTDGANAKNGIDREAQQKADLNGKMDAAATDQKAEEAKTEEARTEQVKAEQVKAEQVKTEQVQTQSLTDKVKEKAKEVMAKAEEIAKTVKEEVGKAFEKAKAAQAAFDAKQKELADLARKPEIRAMLDTIGFTEGTGLNYGKVVNGTVIGQNKKTMGYDTALAPGTTNVSTLDMSQHPNVKVQVNNNLVSSAAGRYQFLSGTWNSLSQKLGLTNFHATTQDLAAVQLMKERRMIEPLLNGDLQTAVNRGANEWASLPKADGNGAYAGQNARSFEAIERAYNGFLNDARAMQNAGYFN
jgi:muramidase (phage lysozyme)